MYATYKYEGIVLLDYATVKKLKSASMPALLSPRVPQVARGVPGIRGWFFGEEVKSKQTFFSGGESFLFFLFSFSVSLFFLLTLFISFFYFTVFLL